MSSIARVYFTDCILSNLGKGPGIVTIDVLVVGIPEQVAEWSELVKRMVRARPLADSDVSDEALEAFLVYDKTDRVAKDVSAGAAQGAWARRTQGQTMLMIRRPR